MSKNTIMALVIAGMKTNWAYHYMRANGISKLKARTVCIAADPMDTRRLTGNIKNVRFYLDIY